jgi:drug/metabolite transporter (DMT)-like permease
MSAIAPPVGHGSQAKPTAVMALVVVIYGLGIPLMKLISAPPLVSAAVRSWLLAPLLLGFALATGRRISVRTLRRTALPGCVFGVNLVLVFAALPHISVAVLSVILALQPGVVLVVAGPWLHEQATRWHVAWTVVGLFGVTIVVLGGSSAVHSDGLGIAMAAGAMLSHTTYYLLNRRMRFSTGMDPVEWMFGVTVFAGLAIAPVAIVTSSPADFGQLGGADWLWMAFQVVLSGAVAHTLMTWTHRYIPAARSSLYLLGMNVVAVAAAWPIHGETVTFVQAIGAATVLGAVAAVISRPGSVHVAPIAP